MLGLPGAAYLYQGQELGLPEVDVPEGRRQDPAWARNGVSRDGCRVPMPWTAETAGTHGFSTAGDGEPWLPVPDGWGPLSVEAQSGDEASMLVLCRCALRIRAQLHRNGEVSADDVVVWERTGDGRLVAAREGGISLVLAMGDEAVPLPDGDVLHRQRAPDLWRLAARRTAPRGCDDRRAECTPHPQPSPPCGRGGSPAEPQVCGSGRAEPQVCGWVLSEPLGLRGGEEGVEELLGRGSGGQLTAAYALLGVGQDRPDGGVRVQGLQQRVAEHRPHPLHVLAAAPLDQRAVVVTAVWCRCTASQTSSRPAPVSPLQVSTGTRQDGAAGSDERIIRSAPESSRAVRRASAARSPSALFTAITSASSRMPFLMPCSSSPVRAERQQQERVDHVGDGDLRLPDADRLDEHDVVAGRLDTHDRLARRPGDAAERARRSATAG